MNAPAWRRGLYLLTPDETDTQRLLERVAAVIRHASLLQYRNKAASHAMRVEQASALLPLCRQAGVPLVINDDVDVARRTGAEGVHLGEHDAALQVARGTLGPGAIIGVSCYDDIGRARTAALNGADYIAFGAFHPSVTKPGARRADPSLLQASASLGVTRVAIGGITPDNAPALVQAGADLVAAVSGVFDAPDPAAAARAYRACFE